MGRAGAGEEIRKDFEKKLLTNLKRRGKIAKLNFIVRDLAEMKAPKEIEKNLKKVLDKQG